MRWWRRCFVPRSYSLVRKQEEDALYQDYVRQDDDQRRDDDTIGGCFANAVRTLVGGVAIEAGDDGDEVSKHRSFESGGNEIGEGDAVKGTMHIKPQAQMRPDVLREKAAEDAGRIHKN